MLVVFGSGAADGISKNEFDCWEAVQHLMDCCPNSNFDKISCSVGIHSCGNHPPDLSDEEAKCIEAMSCRAILDNGFCTTPRPTVCQ